jgi:hypothetical protein
MPKISPLFKESIAENVTILYLNASDCVRMKKVSAQLTLYKPRQHLTTGLQQRVSNHNLQKSLKPLSSVFNHIIAESVCEYLSRQGRNGDSRRFTLQDIAKVFKVGITSAYVAMSQFESGDICSAYNLVICVHVAAHSVGFRISYLAGGVSKSGNSFLDGLDGGGLGNCAAFGKIHPGRTRTDLPLSPRSSLEVHRFPQSFAGANLALPAWLRFICELRDLAEKYVLASRQVPFISVLMIARFRC